MSYGVIKRVFWDKKGGDEEILTVGIFPTLSDVRARRESTF